MAVGPTEGGTALVLFSEQELANRIRIIEVMGGNMDLTVKKTVTDPDIGLTITRLRGQLRIRLDLDCMVMDFDASVEIDLSVAAGIPFIVKFEGTISGRGTAQDQWGRMIPCTLKGESTVLQICRPDPQVIMALGAGMLTPNLQVTYWLNPAMNAALNMYRLRTRHLSLNAFRNPGSRPIHC